MFHSCSIARTVVGAIRGVKIDKHCRICLLKHTNETTNLCLFSLDEVAVQIQPAGVRANADFVRAILIDSVLG